MPSGGARPGSGRKTSPTLRMARARAAYEAWARYQPAAVSWEALPPSQQAAWVEAARAALSARA